MSARHWISILLLPAFLACADNPTSPAAADGGGDEGGDDHADATADLVVDLQLSSGHVHILSELILTATVTDHHGEAVTDFDSLVVERKAADSDTWRSIHLELEGSSYVGAYTFSSSGEYELRVAGRRPGDAAMVQMTHMTDTSPMSLHAVRAHAEAAGYRIEFETFPGHLHQNDVGTIKFWVMEQERDADGNRAAIAGLSPDIVCLEADGSTETHQAAELEIGVYEAEHTFASVGDFVAALNFVGMDGEAGTAEFTTHVVHGH